MNKKLLAVCLLALSLLVSGCGPRPTLTAAPTPVPSVPTPAPTAIPTAAPTEPPLPATPAPTGMPVIFDDDGSPDGTTALFYLLSDPAVSVKAAGISFGEAHPAIYIQHIGRKLDQFGITDIPLGAGQDGPLAGTNEFPEWVREAANGFWGFPLPNPDKTYPAQDAAELIVATINGSPEPVHIFVSGPCTNLAQALWLNPDIRENIADVTIMGGAVYVPGNLSDIVPDPTNMVAEWNIYGDPQAASEVFESGLNINLVPLDATNLVKIDRQDLQQWRAGGATANSAADIYEALMNFRSAQTFSIWDLMTAAIMVRHDLCGFQPLHLEVVTDEGDTSGQTVVVAGQEPNVQVCLQPDANRIKQTLIDVFSTSE